MVEFWITGHGQPLGAVDPCGVEKFHGLCALAEDVIIKGGNLNNGLEDPRGIYGPQDGTSTHRFQRNYGTGPYSVPSRHDGDLRLGPSGKVLKP